MSMSKSNDNRQPCMSCIHENAQLARVREGSAAIKSTMIPSNSGTVSHRSGPNGAASSSVLSKELKQRERVVTPRPPQLSQPMDAFRRTHFESQNYLPRPLWNVLHAITESRCCANKYNRLPIHNSSADTTTHTQQQQQRRQYTLEWKPIHKSKYPCLNLRQKLCWICSRTTRSPTHYANNDPSYCLGININNLVSTYISWTYRTSYLLLFGAFGICYFGLILLFSVVYLWVARKIPECITSGGVPIGSNTVGVFSDCFHLSWTTFSTVGYGLIYPATGAEDFEVAHACVGLGVLGSFEAFLGVLYAGFCGAILFGKVLRSQSIAQVFFSDPIVIRYGKEELDGWRDGGSGDDGRGSSLVDEDEEEKCEDLEEGNGIRHSWSEASPQANDAIRDMNDDNNNNIPCPMLVFRLVNRLHDVSNGEIVDAKLRCVAILDPKFCHEDVLHSAKLVESTPPNTGNGNKQVRINEQTTISELAEVLEQEESSNNIARRGLAFFSSDSKQPRIFCKLTLDTEEHPFFRRVWFGRHKLDENSPLLTQHARDRVKQCGGYWPPEMNNYKSIKRNIHFCHLLVCIKGTSNANARSVHAQKVYDLVDVNVGYRFIPMNYHAPDGEIKTDAYLLNAVYEQRGGGAEPFS